MKIEKSSQSVDKGPQSGITKENYVEKAKEFVKARDNEGFVIRAREGLRGSIMTGLPATEPQWIAWMSYLDGKGVPTTFAKSLGMTTVPCEWPEDFDVEAPMSDRDAPIVFLEARSGYRFPLSPRSFANMYRELSASLSMIRSPKASRGPLTAEELAEVYRQRDAKNGPPRLSQAALEAFQEHGGHK